MSKRNWKDMREFLDFLKEKDDIIYIAEEVDPEWEINGFTRTMCQKQGPALYFQKIKGMNYPMVAGMLASDKRYLWALGLEEEKDLNRTWGEMTRELIPPVIVKKAPCQEEIFKPEDIDLDKICNVKWHEQDGGPYPGTISISVTKDYDAGAQNAGIYRMATLGKNRLSWGAAPYSHGQQHLNQYEKQGKPMPLAIVTGVDPISEIVGATRTAPGIDEFYLAGALRGEPLEVVKCKTIDINVPATAEWVFEGYVYPGVRELDRNFGEVTSYYGEAHRQPVFEIKMKTHRKSPIYQGTREQWYPSESTITCGKSSQGDAFKILKGIVPGLLDMKCDVTFQAIVKIDKLFKGHPQQVMDAIWGATYARYKHVIVVDKDIDIWDYDSLQWALSTRVKADRDVTINSRRAGGHRDPSSPTRERGYESTMGIDATMKNEEYEFWGEPVPTTVDDLQTVERFKKKWGEKLKL
jgi:UbiD family decarboxylase